jgi:ammonium transporter, Amt family
LIVGALAERIRFSAVLIFVVVWLTLSYIPIAHMVWGGGLLASHGALDFAGGTVVHINAAIAGEASPVFIVAIFIFRSCCCVPEITAPLRRLRRYEYE